MNQSSEKTVVDICGQCEVTDCPDCPNRSEVTARCRSILVRHRDIVQCTHAARHDGDHQCWVASDDGAAVLAAEWEQCKPRLVVTIERWIDVDLSDPDELEMFKGGQPFGLYELLQRRLGAYGFKDVEVDARFEP